MDPISNGRKFLYPLNLQFFADPAGGAGGEGGGDGGAGGNPAGNDPANGGAGGEGGTGGEGSKGGNDPAKDLAAQLEQLKADMAKQKQALDAATSEAAKYKKELRTKQTQEEIDAANKKEAEEKQLAHLAELEKKVAKAENTKAVMGKLSVDEETAGKIAESLIGCENVDNALLLIKQAWDAKEKALKIEFGKIPPPGAGGSSEEDAEEKAAIELAKRLGKERSEANKSVAEGLKGYIR